MSSKTSYAVGLAGRYATALFALAKDAGELDQVAADLKDLGAMIGESADLDRLLRSPVVSRSDQGKAMAALAAKAGLSATVTRFLGVLAQNRRLFALGDIIVSFQQILADHRGEVSAEVTSAKPLSQNQLQAIVDALKSVVGASVTVDTKVDPGLLGGLVVKMGSRMVDSSLRTKLQQLRLSMKGVG